MDFVTDQFLYFLGGAATAVVSMWLGGLLFFRLLERRERRRLLQTQLAELVSQAFEVEQWLRRLRSAELMNGPPLEEPSPMKQVNMIAWLFVPELRAEVKRLNTAAIAFEAWVQQGVADKRDSRSVSQATLEKYPVVQRAVLDSITDIASKAESLVRQ
ncbi:MAG TPA: hypothetical protein ENK38_02815 [Gammaproteobacteria bacterium]|nr:hypothetical protein [Gammaproteobacteria bacterium]